MYGDSSNGKNIRFTFDPSKSELLRRNPKRKIGFEETQEIWQHPYYEDCRSNDPEQFRAIGRVNGKLYTVIFEVRDDEEGQYYHLVTLWKATSQEEHLYAEYQSSYSDG